MQHVYMHPVLAFNKNCTFSIPGSSVIVLTIENKVIVSPAVPPGWLSTNSLERLSVQMPFSVDTDKSLVLLVLWQLIPRFSDPFAILQTPIFLFVYLCLFQLLFFLQPLYPHWNLNSKAWLPSFPQDFELPGCTFRQSGRVCVWELAIGLVGLGFTSPELLINPLRLPKLVMPTITTTNTAADAKTGFITGRAL